MFGQGTWTQKANFNTSNIQIKNQFSFSIGNKGYVGGGEGSGTIYNTFFEYNSLTNTWTQKANYSTVSNARTKSASFSIGNKGYVIGGIIGSNPTSSVIEYDTLLNLWTSKANFGGGNRHSLIGFTIGNKGYAGTGVTTGLTYNALKSQVF